MSERLAVLGDAYTFLANSEETREAYLTVRAEIGPGNGPPLHVHRREEESFFVLEGEMTFWLDGEKLSCGPGSFVRIPPGRPHRFQNESDQVVTMLFTVVPSGRLDHFFREIGQPLSEGETPPPPTPEVIARVMERAPHFGLEIRV